MEDLIKHFQSFPIPIKININGICVNPFTNNFVDLSLQKINLKIFDSNSIIFIYFINDTKLNYSEMYNLCNFLYFYYYKKYNLIDMIDIDWLQGIKVFIKNFIKESLIQINNTDINKKLKFQTNNFSPEEKLQIYRDYQAEGFFNINVGSFYAFETKNYFQGECYKCKVLKKYKKAKKIKNTWLATLTKYHSYGYCFQCFAMEYKSWSDKIKLWNEKIIEFND